MCIHVSRIVCNIEYAQDMSVFKGECCTDFVMCCFLLYLKVNPNNLIPNIERNGSSGFYTSHKNVFYDVP